jgi:hypothetical protein
MASDGMKDGAGGGAGSTYPLRMILATPRASDAGKGGRGDVLAQLQGQANRHAGMLPTPTATRYGSQSYPEDPSKKRPSLETLIRMPTPLASDRKGSLGITSNGKAKSQNVPTFLRDQKWDYARQIAAVLADHGLTGPSQTLPVTYGWMMGYPAGWLALALRSAVQKGLLPLASLSRRSGTRSARKYLKRSDERS